MNRVAIFQIYDFFNAVEMKYVALKIDIVQIILSTMVINRIKHIYFDNYSFQIKTKRKLIEMNQNLNEPK